MDPVPTCPKCESTAFARAPAFTPVVCVSRTWIPLVHVSRILESTQ
jgi:hypothetical protein